MKSWLASLQVLVRIESCKMAQLAMERIIENLTIFAISQVVAIDIGRPQNTPQKSYNAASSNSTI